MALKSAGTGQERKCSFVMSGENSVDRASPFPVSDLKRRQSSSQCGGAKWDHRAISLQVKLEVLRRFEAREKLGRIG